MTAEAGPRPQVDTSRPHPARVYDWLLGGKDNYPVDREVAKRLPAEAKDAARQNRAFMHRAVAWLAEQGADQFLDIGTGIPTEPNLHQVVQAVRPAARIVYTDNDPIVLRHAEALLVSGPAGGTDYIQSDVRTPEAILEHARAVLDFERPVVLSLIALLHFVTDDQDPYGIVRTLVGALPSGSHLVMSHAASDIVPELSDRTVREYAKGGIRLAFRTRAEFGRFFDGLELLDPGVVPLSEWYRGGEAPEPEMSGIYAAVARIP